MQNSQVTWKENKQESSLYFKVHCRKNLYISVYVTLILFHQRYMEKPILECIQPKDRLKIMNCAFAFNKVCVCRIFPIK